MEWDESQEFPVHIFKEMGKLGLMGVLVPEEYGGAGSSIFNAIIAIEELARVDVEAHAADSRHRPLRR